jgi:hypothetical protein
MSKLSPLVTVALFSTTLLLTACATSTPVGPALAGAPSAPSSGVLAWSDEVWDAPPWPANFTTTLLYMQTPACYVLAATVPSGCMASTRCRAMGGCCEITAVEARPTAADTFAPAGADSTAPTLQHVAYWIGVGRCEQPTTSELFALASSASSAF